MPPPGPPAAPDESLPVGGRTVLALRARPRPDRPRAVGAGAFGTPIVDGDQAAVPWRAQTKLNDGGTENLAGVSLLRFDAGGLVVEEHDYYQEG